MIMKKKKLTDIEKKFKRIRKRKSYKRWSGFYKFLDKNPSKAMIMQAVGSIIDDLRGFRTQTHSDYNYESAGVVLQDNGYCDKCDYKLKCMLTKSSARCQKWNEEQDNIRRIMGLY